MSFASCCQVFVFFMNFAALAGTEIAQKLLLPLRLPARLCGLPVSFRTSGSCSVLCCSQSHPGIRCWEGWGIKILLHSRTWVSLCHLLGGWEHLHTLCLAFSFSRMTRPGKCSCWVSPRAPFAQPPSATQPEGRCGDNLRKKSGRIG